MYVNLRHTRQTSLCTFYKRKLDSFYYFTHTFLNIINCTDLHLTGLYYSSILFRSTLAYFDLTLLRELRTQQNHAFVSKLSTAQFLNKYHNLKMLFKLQKKTLYIRKKKKKFFLLLPVPQHFSKLK